VTGSVPIRDLNREMDWTFPREATTVEGLGIHEARSIPERGRFYLPRIRLRVRAARRQPLTALRIVPLPRERRAAAEGEKKPSRDAFRIGGWAKEPLRAWPPSLLRTRLNGGHTVRTRVRATPVFAHLQPASAYDFPRPMRLDRQRVDGPAVPRQRRV